MIFETWMDAPGPGLEPEPEPGLEFDAMVASAPPVPALLLPAAAAAAAAAATAATAAGCAAPERAIRAAVGSCLLLCLVGGPIFAQRDDDVL